MLFSLLYDFVLALLGLALMPKLLYQKWVKGKYKQSLRAKWGAAFYKIKRDQNKLIWIHAVSVGETKAIAPLVKLLKQQDPKTTILITNTTETGLDEAKKSIPEASYHLFLPYDFSFIIGPIIKHVRPNLVLLSESDFWYHFLTKAKENGAEVILVNGKISERSLDRLKLFTPFAKRLFAPFTQLYVQSARYKERFEQLKIAPEKIKITGNLKLDIDPSPLSDKALDDLLQKFYLSDSPVLVAGSTHAPEEKIILEAFQKLLKTHPALKLILVPRHPERFNEVAEMIKAVSLPFSRLSEGINSGSKVILIDAMGKLKECYQLATIAFVGGSFTSKVGGHNILEPLYYGVPVLFGPYMHTQLDFVDMVLSSSSGIQVTEETFVETVDRLLADPDLRSSLAIAGKALTDEQRGSAERTFLMMNAEWEGGSQ